MNVKELYEEFKKPFPKEAYKGDSSRGFELTTLKSQYIVERLNETVGVNGWELLGEYREIGVDDEGVPEGVVFDGDLVITIKDGTEVVTMKKGQAGFGQCERNIGDGYKGARTDCLSKCASLFGIGNEMFKGNISPDGDLKAEEDESEETVEAAGEEQEAAPVKKKKTRKKKTTSSRFNKKSSRF